MSRQLQDAVALITAACSGDDELIDPVLRAVLDDRQRAGLALAATTALAAVAIQQLGAATAEPEDILERVGLLALATP